jgi:hypothetical protein
MRTTVRSAARRLPDRLVSPAPAERLAALRVLVGAFALVDLVVRIPHLVASARLPEHRWLPVGVLGPLGSAPPAPLLAAVIVTTLLAGAAFVAGVAWRAAGPAFALGTLLLATYTVSWGHVLHTENLLVLHLLVLGVSPAAACWAVGTRRSAAGRPPPAGRYGLPIRLITLITVLTYAIAGWAKLRNGGWDWLSGDVLRNQVAFDNLRKVVLGDRWSPLGAALVRHRWIWPPIGAATVAVELLAPLVLVVRRARPVWAASAWLFHVGTLALMAIMFPYPLSGIAFASLFPVERLVARVPRLLHQRRALRADTLALADARRSVDRRWR